ADNQARQAYESPFRPSGTFIDIGFGSEEAHDFDPGAGVDTCQQITIPVGRTLIQVYQWDEPFFSVSGAPGSASDMDIVLTNAACDTILAGSAAGNVGGDPFEVFGFTNAGPATTFGIRILQFSGPNPGLMKTVNIGSGSITINEFDTKTGTSWGHSAALGGLGVGAADHQDTPAFGQDPPLIETFSSAGGTPILFDTAGDRLATPQIRQQPDITAPDGADTTFFGIDTDGTGFPNFFGTSAAAPHAAGVAALMKDLVPSLTPDAMYAALKATAIDMDDPQTGGFDTGFDFGTGFGLIQADAALDEAAPPPPPLQPPPPPPGPTNAPPSIPTLPPTLPPNATPVSRNPRLGCIGSVCRVPIRCNAESGSGRSCHIAVKIFVPASALRLGDDPAAKAQRRLLFASGVANIPAGQIANVKLKLRKSGRLIARTSTRRRLRGVMEIRSSTGTVSSTGICIRLPRPIRLP
ncbi:MAG: S8 family serine peptidase, partial [Beggiatoa sp.]|nr:S8 family serine peptidase [Beggiatoa sp.]